VNKKIVSIIITSLFATGTIMALLIILQNLAAKPVVDGQGTEGKFGSASPPSLISRDKAVQVALKTGGWNQTLLSEKIIKADLLHLRNNGFAFLVDEKTFEDKSLYGKYPEYDSNPENEEGQYFWNVGITSPTNREWSYFINATDGRLLKSNESKFTNMDLEIYGSYDAGTLAGHFLKGSLYGGSGVPIVNGTITIDVNGMEMGRTTSDDEGCFQFNQWDNDRISNLMNNPAATNTGSAGSSVDLKFAAIYAGDKDHFPANMTKTSTMYLYAVPLVPAGYEISLSPPFSGESVNARQGDKVDFQLFVKALHMEAEVRHMAIDIQRQPCAVSYSTTTTAYVDAVPQEQVTLDHPGIFNITLYAKDYAKPGKYFLAINQDIVSCLDDNCSNRIADNPNYFPYKEVGGFEFEVLPK
jgi:hypothetical protein